MKYPNWSQVFENDPNNEAYDKNMEKVGDLTIDSLTEDECIDNVKQENKLMYLSVEPITKNIQLLHHISAIGGTIAMPNAIIVAISGLGSNAFPVRLDSNLFASTDDFRVPPWVNMESITTATGVATTTATNRNTEMKFRPVIAIPPFLVKTILNAASNDPAQLIVDCYAAITAFNTLHSTDTSYPDATDGCKRIIYFLWGAAHKQISVTVSIPQHDGVVKQYVKDLSDRHLLDAAPITPAASSVVGPSDATLGTLAGNIQNLTSRMETESNDKKLAKDEKKEKFKKLPASSQQIFLYASSRSATEERTSPNPHLEIFLQQSTISRARTHLNQTLASYGCNIDASSVLVASITAGDLIWTQSSHLPEKLTIFLMSKPSPSAKSLSQKDWLKLHLQESNNLHLDDDIIEKLSDFKFDYPKSLSPLRHCINNLIGICRLLFYGDSAISQKVAVWVDHLDQKEMLYEMNFDTDPLFGLKVCLTIDRAIQLFLVSCQEAASFDKINFRYLDFSFDIESIEKGRFICTPPPPLLDLFTATSPSQNPGGGNVKDQMPSQEDRTATTETERGGATNSSRIQTKMRSGSSTKMKTTKVFFPAQSGLMTHHHS